MLSATCVVVPTYWTRSGGDARAADAVYDHPTPVDGESTLPALLDSLAKLDTESFYLLVLVAVTAADSAVQAETRVSKMLESYPHITSVVFGPSHLPWIHDSLRARGIQNYGAYLDLARYPQIRNLQLAVPLILGSQSIVALDDDEIVIDPAFFHKAVEPLGTIINGVRVDGLSGYYEQDNGSILLEVPPGTADSGNIFQRKAAIMNAATQKIQSAPGDIVETPFCFGGNMEFSRELAEAVGFDPGITRGEDIDYLINARLEGKHFLLRKDLRILHRPPKGGSYKDATYHKLEQDVIRFMYEREKLQVAQGDSELVSLTAADLSPYPGDFLQNDIEIDARKALTDAGYPNDMDDFFQGIRDSLAERAKKYKQFRVEWPRLTTALMQDAALSDRLLVLVHSK